MPDREYVPCGECVSFSQDAPFFPQGVCMTRPIRGTMVRGEQEYERKHSDHGGCSDLSERKPVTEEEST